MGIQRLALAAGVSYEALARCRRGECDSLSFDNADALICRGLGDPGLWHSEPALAAIYARS